MTVFVSGNVTLGSGDVFTITEPGATSPQVQIQGNFTSNGGVIQHDIFGNSANDILSVVGASSVQNTTFELNLASGSTLSAGNFGVIFGFPGGLTIDLPSVSFEFKNVTAEFGYAIFRVDSFGAYWWEARNSSLSGGVAVYDFSGTFFSNPLSGTIGALGGLLGGNTPNDFIRLVNIDHVILTAFGDTVTVLDDKDIEIDGGGGADSIAAAGGNDILDGGSDIDLLNGGAGNDRCDGGNNGDDGQIDELVGGLGDDTYALGAGIDEVVEVIGQGTDTILSTVSRDLSNVEFANIENLVLQGTGDIDGSGNTLSNRIDGNSGSNTLSGGSDSAIDTLAGGDGNDVYLLSNALDTVTEFANQGSDTIRSTITRSLAIFAHVEDLILEGTAPISGTGNTLLNRITGNAATNTLDGGGDTLADVLAGGAGNDTYVLANRNDIVSELVNGGIDTIRSTSTRTLVANVEDLILEGSTAINGTGNTLRNTITGNTAANTLDGGSDTLADILKGGAGNDTYLLANRTDTVTELANQGSDTIRSTITRSLATYANVENLTLEGAAAIDATGNTLLNTLTGNTAANVLDGGNDTRADILKGGAGSDTYLLGSRNDTVIELTNQGIDTIRSTLTRSLATIANVENVLLEGAAAIGATGNGLANRLTGNGAINTLDGNTGNDTLVGGLGNDVLFGRAGNDVFLFNSALGPSNIDRIEDYDLVADHIHLDNAFFTGLGAGNLSAAAFIANATGSAADATDRIVYNTTSGELLFDADGSGAAAARAFAVLTTKPLTVNAGDFFVV